ncbi:hypothetical protein GCM10009677_59260 [Sphaerisporangium rubeum]|uniref:VanZ-like domain-containing protein n=1 Tax=Sphaerisporangium rubeum TaxID=321317 RepID=A0A7X0IBA5_9ACTN|nr:VanZ family protein [Sphaerisporangium rubeum]MBB6472006.1 hypothetical protein [Sphaerisporangium rubeum]
MNLSAPHRATRIALAGLAVLGMASAAYAVRRPLMMSVPACASGRWHGCLDTENGVVLMTAAALPLAALLVGALTLLRRAAGVTSPLRRSLAEVGMVYGTAPFVWMTLMPGLGAGVVTGRVSLVPLRDLATMGPIGIGGNLLVFAALGFFAPLRFPALASVPRMLALGAGFSAVIETLQYVLRLDRVSSVDDVLLNATGAALFALASRRWWHTPAQAPPPRPRLATAPAD